VLPRLYYPAQIPTLIYFLTLETHKKMKNFILFIALMATTTLAISQSCPSSLRRNNGNGSCPQGQLILSYPTCPGTADIIDSVYVNGVKYAVVFGAPSACTGPQNQVSYCITSGNMPPTGTWKIYFHNITVIGGFNCVVPEGGPLPISLSAFYAKRVANNVVLNWQTAFEQNAKGFDIQKKVGNEFVTIATIDASNKAAGSSYTYTDMNNSKATTQYRLKMISKDAEYRNSDIRTVKGNGATTEFTVFPNPSNGDATVTVSDISEATDVQVLDNSGRMVKNVSMDNSNSVKLNNLQKGMYMIRIINRNSGEATTKKLSVVH
jgi:hypothetical protein